MDAIEKLTAIFSRFPGIGPRQAGRFVQFLLRSSPSIRRDIAESIRELGASVFECPECKRFHAGEKNTCSLCANPSRDNSLLAVVATDADLSALERSGTFHGRYFVLGGTISLSSDKANGLRIKELVSSLQERLKKGLNEIILAFPANPEGDATAARVKEELQEFSVKVTTLGRGLSTGSELEYADPETLKNALASRR
jgi:recombination protein RecR